MKNIKSEFKNLSNNSFDILETLSLYSDKYNKFEKNINLTTEIRKEDFKKNFKKLYEISLNCLEFGLDISEKQNIIKHEEGVQIMEQSKYYIDKTIEKIYDLNTKDYKKEDYNNLLKNNIDGILNIGNISDNDLSDLSDNDLSDNLSDNDLSDNENI